LFAGVSGLKPLSPALLQQSEELITGHLYITEYLAQQTWAYSFTCVKGHECASAIGVAQESMTALLPYDLEACFLESLHNPFAGQRWQFAHTATL
jgi:hypothetical protein